MCQDLSTPVQKKKKFYSILAAEISEGDDLNADDLNADDCQDKDKILEHTAKELVDNILDEIKKKQVPNIITGKLKSSYLSKYLIGVSKNKYCFNFIDGSSNFYFGTMNYAGQGIDNLKADDCQYKKNKILELTANEMVDATLDEIKKEQQVPNIITCKLSLRISANILTWGEWPSTNLLKQEPMTSWLLFLHWHSANWAIQPFGWQHS